MTPDERDLLVRKLRAIWPDGGPSNMMWADVFDPLEAGQAGTALLRLRNELDKCPTIAQFMGKVREIRTRVQDPTPGDDECRRGLCDGSGWLPATFTRGRGIQADGESVPLTYTGVHPCVCPAGQERMDVWRRAGGTYAGDEKRLGVDGNGDEHLVTVPPPADSRLSPDRIHDLLRQR
jgi:hypothetical protein